MRIGKVEPPLKLTIQKLRNNLINQKYPFPFYHNNYNLMAATRNNTFFFFLDAVGVRFFVILLVECRTLIKYLSHRDQNDKKLSIWQDHPFPKIRIHAATFSFFVSLPLLGCFRDDTRLISFLNDVVHLVALRNDPPPLPLLSCDNDESYNSDENPESE